MPGLAVWARTADPTGTNFSRALLGTSAPECAFYALESTAGVNCALGSEPIMFSQCSAAFVIGRGGAGRMLRGSNLRGRSI